jgi:serine/threonine protein kinase
VKDSLVTNNGRDLRLSRILDAYLAAVETGAAPDHEALLAQHPDLANDLRECLGCLAFIRQAARPADGGGEGAEAVGQGQALGDFRLVRVIGRGGMGVVYEAEQLSLGRRVAVKVLPLAATMDPRHLQRFHNEARAAACLQHPHIVPVYFVGCERGVHFYAMQLIDGRSLAALLADLPRAAPSLEPAAPREPAGGAEGSAGEPRAMDAPAAGTVPVAALSTEGARRDRGYFRRVAELGVQAAEALDHAHQVGIVHRDIKPGNLMLDGRGNLWVTDFGLAQMQHGEGNLTMTGDLVGTLRYMSPEQALGKRVVIDHRTDLYSLGATLYELLTLRPAFDGSERQELLRQVAFEEPVAPRKRDRAIPAELETIVLKALEKNPADRYATAQEMADDLERFLKDEPIRARRPGLAQRAAKWCKRHRAVTLAAVVALVVVTAITSVSAAVVLAAYQSEKDAHQAEQAQRRTAEEERKRADANFRRSVEELTELLKVVNDAAVSGPPQIDRVRQAQANRVIKFSKDLLKENRADPEGRRLTGVAYRALRQAYLGLEDYAQAAALFSLGIETFEHLAADFPDDARYQEALSRVRGLDRPNLMTSALNGGNRLMSAGKWAKAARAYRAALTVSEKHAPLAGQEDQDKMERATLAYGLAQALRALGRSGEAEEPCTVAVDNDAKLIADNSKTVYLAACKVRQAGACTLRGLIRADVGRTAEAEADFRQAIALIEALPPRDRRILIPYSTNQPLAHHALGNLLWAAGRREEATEEFRRAEKGWRDEPRSVRNRSCLAWLLATCPDAQLRKPAEAVELAKQAASVPAWPDARPWQALGAARYRAGDTKEALATLEKSRQLNDGGDGIDFFFLAMACWKQGEKDQARRWYDKAMQWMETGRPHDPELLQLRAEAATLLGLGQKKDERNSDSRK